MTCIYFTTGQNPNVNDPTYDYVDDQAPTTSYKRASDIIFNGKGDDAYHETALYHSSGPSASKALHAGFSDLTRPGAHIYDDASIQVLPGGSDQAASIDPLYEDPVVSQVLNFCNSLGHNSGMHLTII